MADQHAPLPDAGVRPLNKRIFDAAMLHVFATGKECRCSDGQRKCGDGWPCSPGNDVVALPVLSEVRTGVWEWGIDQNRTSKEDRMSWRVNVIGDDGNVKTTLKEEWDQVLDQVQTFRKTGRKSWIENSIGQEIDEKTGEPKVSR
jgi:hypothetical protein